MTVTATTLDLRLTTEMLMASAVDASGVVAGTSSVPLETRSVEAGWLEQRPEEWWDATVAAITELGRETPLASVTSISIACDFAASVFLDGEREVIRPAILEGDARGAHLIRWLRQHQAIAYKRVQHLLQPGDYLRMMLSGVIGTTPGDAGRSGLFDAASGCWDARLCDELEINVELLPPVRGNTVAILGDVAATLGLPESAVVV